MKDGIEYLPFPTMSVNAWLMFQNDEVKHGLMEVFRNVCAGDYDRFARYLRNWLAANLPWEEERDPASMNLLFRNLLRYTLDCTNFRRTAEFFVRKMTEQERAAQQQGEEPHQEKGQ